MSKTLAQELKQFDFFKSLSLDALELFADKLEIGHLVKDEVLFNKGDVGDALYIIEDGWIKLVSADQDGGEMVLNQVGPGSLIGEMAVLNEEPRSAGVVGLMDVKYLKLSSDDFLNVLNDEPSLGLEMSRNIANRLRFATTYIEHAIDWSKRIANGDYEFMEEQLKMEQSTIIGPADSESERAKRFLGNFFKMVEGIKKREEDLKKQLVQLKVVIDQNQRSKEVDELAESDFFKRLRKSKKNAKGD